MASIDECFPQLADLVGEGACSRGFVAADRAESAGAFGGRTAQWRRGGEEIRLTWDGKEQWLTFEYRSAPDQPPALEWTGTLSERYTGQNVTDADLARLRDGLGAVAASVWTRRPPR